LTICVLVCVVKKQGALFAIRPGHTATSRCCSSSHSRTKRQQR
jgi:hypothetical protein